MDLPTLLSSFRYYCTGNEMSGCFALSSLEASAAGALVFLDSRDVDKCDDLFEYFEAFDGSFDNLLHKMKFYDEHYDEYQQHKDRGANYVKDNYSEEACLDRFESAMTMLYENYI
jgi:hypothetical protein